jgi:hypothetical protein
LRYIVVGLILAGTFATALYLRGVPSDAPGRTGERAIHDTVVLDVRPDVRTQVVEGGTELQVHLCFAGSCSRAKLVYEHKGEVAVLDATTNCRRSLKQDGSHSGDGYVSEVALGGTLPHGASNVRIVLESETGTRVAPVEL